MKKGYLLATRGNREPLDVEESSLEPNHATAEEKRKSEKHQWESGTRSILSQIS